MCVLAIQSPFMTLRKMLYDAVDNPGQQPLLVKVLNQLQSKGLFTRSEIYPVTEIQPNMLVFTKNNGPRLLSVNITVGCHETQFYRAKYRTEFRYV